jgi:hypothetical protein
MVKSGDCCSSSASKDSDIITPLTDLELSAVAGGLTQEVKGYGGGKGSSSGGGAGVGGHLDNGKEVL